MSDRDRTAMETTQECDAVLAELLLHGRLDDAASAHVRTCGRCSEAESVVRAVAGTLAADVTPTPPAALAERVLRASAPLLARRARRATWRPVVGAVAAALVPLPLIVVIDVWVVRGAYDLLRAFVPDMLSFYLVLNYAALLALLLTLTYGAVPLLAERQARLRRQELYG